MCHYLQNPFGQAKPRESILAGRSGKKEEDILKDELSKDRLRVMLMEMQKADTETIFPDVEHSSVTSISHQTLRNMPGK